MSSAGPTAAPKRAAHGAFPTTHWSVVRAAVGEETPAARTALDALCRQYWFPIYGFIRRQGRAHHEAEDLTQDFIARLLDNNRLARACPERGRFRTFLLTALRRFLTNEWYRGQTARRGGGTNDDAATAALDLSSASERFAREPMDPELTPEAAFDRAWAVGVIERALATLRDEYAASGRGALFDGIAPIVWGGGRPEPLAVGAQRLGMNEGALKVAIHRVRRRLREHVEALVAETVDETADIAAEVGHLIAAVSRRNSVL